MAALVSQSPLAVRLQPGTATKTPGTASAGHSAVARCESLQALLGVSLPSLVDDPCALGTFSDVTIDTHGRVFHYTPLTNAERDAEVFAARLALSHPQVADFMGGGRYAITALIDDRGDEKYGVPSTGSRYVNVGIARYSDGQTWIVEVDTTKGTVLSAGPFVSNNPLWPAEESSPHTEVAPLNPVEVLLAFAVGDEDPQLGAEISRAGSARYRADVIAWGYGPTACAQQRCAAVAWSGGPFATINLTRLQVEEWRPGRSPWW